MKVNAVYRMKLLEKNDTSLMGEVVMVNPTSLSATHADNEDIKASEIYDASQNLAKNNADGNFSSTRVFPGVPFDSESSKENQSKVPFLSTYSNVKKFKK